MTGTLPTVNSRPGILRGFTLVELLVALTIMMVLVGSVSFSMVKRKPTLKDVSQQVAQQLRLAQQRALHDRREFRIEINLATNTFELVDKTIVLPEDVAITVKTAEDQVIDADSVGMTFFPDASSSGGAIQIESEIESFEIRVAWTTGKVLVLHGDGEG